jgi:hypothetical protein
MPEPGPSLYASAVLVWLPRGELPDVKHFDTSKVQPPPTPNPHPWWLLQWLWRRVISRQYSLNHHRTSRILCPLCSDSFQPRGSKPMRGRVMGKIKNGEASNGVTCPDVAPTSAQRNAGISSVTISIL